MKIEWTWQFGLFWKLEEHGAEVPRLSNLKCSLKFALSLITRNYWSNFLQFSCFRSKQRGSWGVLDRETGKDKKTRRQTAGVRSQRFKTARARLEFDEVFQGGEKTLILHVNYSKHHNKTSRKYILNPCNFDREPWLL